MSLLLKTISIIAPAKCLVCGLEGHDLCPICSQNLARALPERCWRCQKLSLGSKTCSACYRHAPIKNVWVVGEYEEGLKSAVRALKFERRRGLARPLAELMRAKLPFIKNQPIVTNVPTATIRRRIRGYDHAEYLAKELGKQSGWKYIPLIRRQTQARQVGSKRVTRLVQLEGAFRLIRDEYVRGQDILLVDDVVTTGATIMYCSKVLKEAGAKSISVAVLAQKS